MSDLSKRLMMHCGNDSCEPCVKCAQIMQEAADELDRLLAIEREYNICRDRVAEIASRESEQHVEQRREIDRLQAIVDRLQSTLAEIEALASWHCDEDADPLDTSPEDQAAHVNGLIVRLCRKARTP